MTSGNGAGRDGTDAHDAGRDATGRTAGGAHDTARRVPTRLDVEVARARIQPHVTRTPLVRSPFLSAETGAEVWLKLETIQVTGSFKFRGAVNAIARLREDRPDVEAVMTASAGNHGLALATAAARFGIRTRVHLPASAPDAKQAALAALGADLVRASSYDAAEDAAREEATRTDAVFVSPYDDEDVIAGAGTVAMEVLEDAPDTDTIVVPVGGGGLIAGIAIAADGRAAVRGAEAAASPVFSSALAAGRPVTVEVAPTLADGLAGNMDPMSRTFGVVRDRVGEVVTVDEDAIARAMRALVFRDRLVAEGASAVGVAALLAGALPVHGRRVVVVLSGCNVDERVLRSVL
ncbi:MAG: pyridoxal-phosphate dependent enzyme [Vicinamibacterales bacterium]